MLILLANLPVNDFPQRMGIESGMFDMTNRICHSLQMIFFVFSSSIGKLGDKILLEKAPRGLLLPIVAARNKISKARLRASASQPVEIFGKRCGWEDCLYGKICRSKSWLAGKL